MIRHLFPARALLVLPVLVVWTGVAQASPPAAAHHHEEVVGVRSLDISGGGDRLHILFAEQRTGEAKPLLLHQRSDDAGVNWREPVRVDAASPPAFSPRRGMDPQIAADGERLIAVWTTAGTDRWGSGPMATALSRDGGRSWKPGPNPADDGLTTGHGFIDLTADAAGTFHLTWLDSRDGKQGLRYARSSDAGGTWSANATVMAQTCECCANTIAAGSGGIVGILYRGHDPRDMHLALSTDDGRAWTSHRAGSFDWKFPGCPQRRRWAGVGRRKRSHAGVDGRGGTGRHLSRARRKAWRRGVRTATAGRFHRDASRPRRRPGRPARGRLGCSRARRAGRHLGCGLQRWFDVENLRAVIPRRRRRDSSARARDQRRLPCLLDRSERRRPDRLEICAAQARAVIRHWRQRVPPSSAALRRCAAATAGAAPLPGAPLLHETQDEERDRTADQQGDGELIDERVHWRPSRRPT